MQTRKTRGSWYQPTKCLAEWFPKRFSRGCHTLFSGSAPGFLRLLRFNYGFFIPYQYTLQVQWISICGHALAHHQIARHFHFWNQSTSCALSTSCIMVGVAGRSKACHNCRRRRIGVRQINHCYIVRQPRYS